MAWECDYLFNPWVTNFKKLAPLSAQKLDINIARWCHHCTINKVLYTHVYFIVLTLFQRNNVHLKIHHNRGKDNETRYTTYPVIFTILLLCVIGIPHFRDWSLILTLRDYVMPSFLKFRKLNFSRLLFSVNIIKYSLSLWLGKGNT